MKMMVMVLTVMMVMTAANTHYVPGTKYFFLSTLHILTCFISSGGGHELFAELMNSE